jgi:predicted O-methyltransferase YrrM
LLIYGDRDGVSSNFLQKSTDGLFLSIEQLVKFEREFPREIIDYLGKGKELFHTVSKTQSCVTNARWNAEEQLFTLLYSLIKANNSKLIIETGVANGITTNAIMKALEESGANGELNSFDVLPETRKAYSGGGNWKFHLLKGKNVHKQIKSAVSSLPKVDVWVHDSNHGYRWQKFEYLLALSVLSKNGILISDDIDASSAWGELAKTHFRKSYVIFDSRKFIGIALK